MQRSAITPHATDLTTVADLRRRVVDQERRLPPGIILPPGRDAYSWQWPGDRAISTMLSDPRLMRVSGVLFTWQGVLDTAGDSSTTVNLLLGNTVIVTTVFAAGQTIAWTLPSFPVTARFDVLRAQVAAVGSGAIGLTMEAVVQSR